MDREDLIPTHWKSDILKSLKPGLVDKWKNYSELICKNKDLKSYLIYKQNNICPWCGKSLYSNKDNYPVIHHISYTNICTGELIKGFSSGDFISFPNCMNCERLEECVEDLVVMHTLCNKEINDYQLKYCYKENCKKIQQEQDLVKEAQNDYEIYKEELTTFLGKYSPEEMFKYLMDLYHAHERFADSIDCLSLPDFTCERSNSLIVQDLGMLKKLDFVKNDNLIDMLIHYMDKKPCSNIDYRGAQEIFTHSTLARLRNYNTICCQYSTEQILKAYLTCGLMRFRCKDRKTMRVVKLNNLDEIIKEGLTMPKASIYKMSENQQQQLKQKYPQLEYVWPK